MTRMLLLCASLVAFVAAPAFAADIPADPRSGVEGSGSVSTGGGPASPSGQIDTKGADVDGTGGPGTVSVDKPDH